MLMVGGGERETSYGAKGSNIIQYSSKVTKLTIDLTFRNTELLPLPLKSIWKAGHMFPSTPLIASALQNDFIIFTFFT